MDVQRKTHETEPRISMRLVKLREKQLVFAADCSSKEVVRTLYN
jgi:hypothetical protein